MRGSKFTVHRSQLKEKSSISKVMVSLDLKMVMTNSPSKIFYYGLGQTINPNHMLKYM